MNFIYNKREDYYICPTGNILHKRGNRIKDGKSYEYAGSKKYCNNNCPLRLKCTSSLRDEPKILRRNIYQEFIDFQLANYGSPEWKKVQDKGECLFCTFKS